jgi:tRNA modification GTPase
VSEETIAAVATPPGEGGIGIVRISGSAAYAIGLSLFRFSRQVLKPKSHRLYYGHVVNPADGRAVDEALVAFMQAPHTYTREDVVEINCHGGIMPLAKILELVLAAGARLAQPGEFTQRAFLNGRIDLAQAEAVIQIIRAKTEQAMELSLAQLQGRLSKQVRAVRQSLLRLLSHLEAAIDFPEHHDVEDLALQELRSGITAALAETETLLQTADQGRIMREGVRTAIIGRPNVGKSSLLNALLGEQRAIVTAVPGTTRDVLEESINLGGVALTIVDTAGIRETADEAEKIGVERAKKALRNADLILYVLDLSAEVDMEDREILASIQEKPCILVGNKTDLVADVQELAGKFAGELPPFPFVGMSLLEGQGLELLEQTIISLIFQGSVYVPQSAMVTTARHKDALKRTSQALEELLAALAAGYAPDLLAIDLHTAVEALGEITGESVAADLTEEIFRNFCVGK